MEDNEYSLGVTEDSSSRVSYDQGSDETGHGGDSSMLMEGIEGGFSGKCIIQAFKTVYICIPFLAFLILTLNQVGIYSSVRTRQ